MGPPRRPHGFRPLRRTVWDDRGFRAVRGAGVSLAAASGYFARCDGRVFRPLRRATRALPLDPRIFSRKNSVKAFSFSQKGELP